MVDLARGLWQSKVLGDVVHRTCAAFQDFIYLVSPDMDAACEKLPI